MPDKTVEYLVRRLIDICAHMLIDPSKAVKRTQGIKGICNKFAAIALIKAGQDMF